MRWMKPEPIIQSEVSERKKKGKKKRERKRMMRKLNLEIYGKCNNEL